MIYPSASFKVVFEAWIYYYIWGLLSLIYILDLLLFYGSGLSIYIIDVSDIDIPYHCSHMFRVFLHIFIYTLLYIICVSLFIYTYCLSFNRMYKVWVLFAHIYIYYYTVCAFIHIYTAYHLTGYIC